MDNLYEMDEAILFHGSGHGSISDYVAQMENVATNGTKETYEVATGQDYLVPIFTGIIIAFGLIFNAIAITINCMLEDYKKASHWYVLNLAIADTIFLLVLPLDVVYHVLGTWTTGTPLCIVYKTMFYGNYYAGIFFLTVMSFDRYVAILHPMSSFWRKFRSREGCWVTTVVVWLLAISASFPLALNTKVLPDLEEASMATNHCEVMFHGNETEAKYIRMGIPPENSEEASELEMKLGKVFNSAGSTEDRNEEIDDILSRSDNITQSGIYCKHPPDPAFITWIYTNFVLTYVIPVGVMTFCYGCILWRILHPRIQSSGSTKSFLSNRNKSSTKSANRRSNHRVTLLVILLVTAFLGCWTPFHAVNIAKINGIPLSSDPVYTCQVIADVARILAYSSCLFNPLLYTFLGANFNKRAGKAWNRIKVRNSATKEFFASFKYSKSSTRSSTLRSNKGSSSDTAGVTHTNTNSVPPLYRHEESLASA